ncbi:MAG: hypothetical protein M3R13_06540 [Armatimonadota bacterium]|nr:hypothetical protein [Armatimonadota bacterium]
MRPAFILFTALLCVGCAPPEPPATLEEGTELQLMLLTELASGEAKLGEEIALLVTENVTSIDNRILIPRGAVAYGRVAWSRSAGALSKFVNEPARLAINIDRTTGIDGKTVFLRAKKVEDGEPFHLTGSNTGTIRASAALTKYLEDPEARKAIESLLSGLKGGEMGSSESIAKIAEDLELKSTEQLAKQHSLKDLEYTIGRISTGDLTRVATGDPTVVIEAITELAGLRFAVGDRISGIFKGRNIRAYPGTPLRAYVAQTKEVDAPAAK